MKNNTENNTEKVYFYDGEFNDKADIIFLVRGFVMSGHLNDIKNIIEALPNFSFDFTQLALSACKNGHLESVQYFFENHREKINLYEPYSVGTYYVPDGFLLTSFFEKKLDVVNYLLYDVHFEIARDTKNYLSFHNEEQLMHIISKRDLFYSLNKNISEKNQIKHIKQKSCVKL